MGSSSSKDDEDKRAQEASAADGKAVEAAEAARKAEEERKATEAAEAARKAEEERKAKEAAEAAKQASAAAQKAEEDPKAKETGTAEAVKTEEVEVEVEAEEAAAPAVAQEGPLEPCVRRAAALLRKLKPEQRPATPERLESWLLSRCCSRSTGGIQPSALAAALHKQLGDHPELQGAIKLFISSSPGGDMEAFIAKCGTKSIVDRLVRTKAHFLSKPLVWRFILLSKCAETIPGSFRPKPAAVFAELCARSIVAKTTSPEGVSRLTYNNFMLSKVPEPVATTSREKLHNMSIEGKEFKAMVATAKSSLSMPFLYKDVSMPLGRGFVRKANLEALTDGATDAKEIAKRLHLAATRFVKEAAEATMTEAPSHTWAKARVQEGNLVVAIEIAPKPKDEGAFEEELRKRVKAVANTSYDIVVRDVVLDGAFIGHKGSNLKEMEKALEVGIAMDRKTNAIGIARGLKTKLSEAELRKVIAILAGQPAPFKIDMQQREVKHIVGKGGQKLMKVMGSSRTRLRVSERSVEGWPSAGRLPPAGAANFMKDFEERLKDAETEAKRGIKGLLDAAERAQDFERSKVFEKGSKGAKLERTFSTEFHNMKHDRSAKRQTNQAKKALAASRRHGGGRGRRLGDELEFRTVSRIMEMRREVLTGIKALGELYGFDNTSEEQIEQQREALEDSMRDLLLEATEALNQLNSGGASSLKVVPLVREFKQLLDPDNFRDMSTRSMAEGDLLERINGSTVWQRLDALAKTKPAPQQHHKELLVHVRKGQPKLRDTEKGGRYKPGEVASATGQSVEEGIEGKA